MSFNLFDPSDLDPFDVLFGKPSGGGGGAQPATLSGPQEPAPNRRSKRFYNQTGAGGNAPWWTQGYFATSQDSRRLGD